MSDATISLNEGGEGDGPVSLTDAIASAYDEIDAGGAEGDDDGDDPAPKEKTAVAANAATPKAVGDDEAAAEPAEGETAAVVDPAPGEAPADFNAEEKTAFATLTPEAQGLVASYAKRSQSARVTTANELNGLREQYGPIGETLKAYEPYLKSAGANAGEVISGLMPYYAHLALGTAEQKRAAIDTLARQFGVELTQPQEADGEEYVDPQIEDLQKQIAKLQQSTTQSAEVLQAARRTEIEGQIDAFKNAKDEKDAVKYPHFDRVNAVMGKLIAGGVAKGMEDAYSQAVALDTDVQKEIAATKAEAARGEADKKAKAAQKAATVNKGSTRAPAGDKAPLSISDSVEEAFDELYG